MKLKKLLAFLTATAAVIPFSAYSMNMTAPPAVYAEDSTESTLPDWIPTDFDSAVEFYNTYGETHIADGLLCVVFREEKKRFHEDEYECFPRYTIRTSSADVAKIKKMQLCSTDDCEECFQVIVYAPNGKGDLTVSLIDRWRNTQQTSDSKNNSTVSEYTFHVDDDLNITETDIYGWLPDCITEYNDYVSKNGKVSSNGNYVVFCLSFSAGTPYTWKILSDSLECFKPAPSSNCTEFEKIVRDGGTEYSTFVYQAVKDGHEKIEYGFGRIYTTGEIDETLTADCVILDDAQTVLLPSDKRISIFDYDTGLPVDVVKRPGFAAQNLELSPGAELKSFDITSNPYVIHNFTNEVDPFFDILTPSPYIFPLDPETLFVKEDYRSIKQYENGAEELIFRPRLQASGDIDKNGDLTVADLVLLQKWLLSENTEISFDLETADFNKDGIVDIFDLVKMKRKLLNKGNITS